MVDRRLPTLYPSDMRGPLSLRLSIRVFLLGSLALAAAPFVLACTPESTEPSGGLPGDNPQVEPDAGSKTDGAADAADASPSRDAAGGG